jgi:hypothetical protein
MNEKDFSTRRRAPVDQKTRAEDWHAGLLSNPGSKSMRI